MKTLTLDDYIRVDYTVTLRRCPLESASRSVNHGYHFKCAVYSLTDPTSKTVSSFYYDYQGRLIQSHRKEALGGDGHIHQSLTFTGKPYRTRETVELPDGRIDSLVTVRSYDGQDRLVSETTSLNGRSQSVSYGYDETGRMTGRIYGTEANPSTLTETLSYNIRDQLTGLNSSVFSMTLRYQEPTLGSVPKYNGGISEWEWNHGAGAETNAWSLSYDGVGRLTDARRFVSGVQTNSFSERSITYDRNSNSLTLTRYGENAATPEERLAYSYDGNLLSGISNTGASGGGGSFTHDTNGNLTRDGLSTLDIDYNDRNLTSRLSFPDYDDTEIVAKVCLDTLESESASLSYEQQNQLYNGVNADYADIPTKKKRYEAVREDPYYNALQLKYANAITCHKSQGGQWSCVFIDNPFWQDELTVDDLKWLYTALTRATAKVYLVNFKDEYFA